MSQVYFVFVFAHYYIILKLLISWVRETSQAATTVQTVPGLTCVTSIFCICIYRRWLRRDGRRDVGRRRRGWGGRDLVALPVSARLLQARAQHRPRARELARTSALRVQCALKVAKAAISAPSASASWPELSGRSTARRALENSSPRRTAAAADIAREVQIQTRPVSHVQNITCSGRLSELCPAV